MAIGKRKPARKAPAKKTATRTTKAKAKTATKAKRRIGATDGEHKTISGLKFKKSVCSLTKKEAISTAAKKRAAGNLARMIKSKTGKYCVYTRAKAGQF